MGTGVKVLLGVVVVVAALVGLVSMLPTSWEAQGDVRIEAPVALVHEHVNDFHAWRDWATPVEADPTARYAYEGPSSGVGSVQIWWGNSGKGRMKITRSEPEAGVWYESAVGSDQTNGSGSLTYQADGDATRVVWRGEGRLWPIIGGVFAAAIGTGVSDYYDFALGNLKKLVEAKAGSSG